MSTLIIYATKHGAAEKCVSLISKKLKGQADICNLKNDKAPELDKYDKVIIGGSVYVGRIMKEISDFCAQNIEKLKTKKLGLFICCMNHKEAETQLNNAYDKEIHDKAVVALNLGGEFRFGSMNFFERFIIKMISKAMAKDDKKFENLNTKEDFSLLLSDNIDKFAEKMNQA